MTWNEFKTEVERLMDRDDISKDIDIDFIALDRPWCGDVRDTIFVADGPNDLLSICN